MSLFRSILFALCVFAVSVASAADDTAWYMQNTVADRGPGMAGLCSGSFNLVIKQPQEEEDCDGFFDVLFYADLKNRKIYWSKAAARSVSTKEYQESSTAVLRGQLRGGGKQTLEDMRAFYLGAGKTNTEAQLQGALNDDGLSKQVRGKATQFYGVYHSDCVQDNYRDNLKTCKTALIANRVYQTKSGQLNIELSDVFIGYASGEGQQVKLTPKLEQAEIKFREMKLNGSMRWVKVNDVKIPLEYQCDFQKGGGETKGVASFSHPQMDGVPEANFSVRCSPLALDKIEEQKKAEREKTKEADRKNAEDARKASPEYKARSAAHQIRVAQELIDDARKAIANEEEIGRVSGYVNKARLHEAGSRIVFYQNMQREQWAVYKSNGGTAKSVSELIKKGG